MEIAVKDITKKVERIKSPITFKPIVEKNENNSFLVKVYILINPMESKEINIAKEINFTFSPKLKLITGHRERNNQFEPTNENINFYPNLNIEEKYNSF
ncbi:MAG: hypothetical protein IPQ19_04485 [Bacteroidetes bacterium]|nr:hypothetical protein [Bacteroidota bacterium]